MIQQQQNIYYDYLYLTKGGKQAKEKLRWVKSEGEGRDRGENPTERSREERRKRTPCLKKKQKTFLSLGLGFAEDSRKSQNNSGLNKVDI